MANLEMNTL